MKRYYPIKLEQMFWLLLLKTELEHWTSKNNVKEIQIRKLKILGRNLLSWETKNLCPFVCIEIDNIGFNERNQNTNLIGRYLKRGTVQHLMIFDSELAGSF